MTVTTNIEIDLVNRGIFPRISGVQNDANTRALEISLTADGEVWQVPADITAAVAYRKPDGTRGLYDTLPDGSSAVSVSGNVVTAILAPQVLTVAGEISAAVILNDKDLNQLATFPFVIVAAPNPAAGAVSEDYYAYSTMEDVSNAVEEWLKETEAEKKAFLSEAEDALTTIRQIVTESEDAPVIVCQETGETIVVSDSSNRLIHGLNIYGKTTQDGTPTIDNPVDMESVGSGGSIAVYTTGKNLFDSALLSQEPGYNTYDETTGLWTSNSKNSFYRSLFYNVVGQQAKRDITKLLPVPPNTNIRVTFNDFVAPTNDTTSNLYANDINYAFYDENGVRTGGGPLASSNYNSKTITTPNQKCWLDIQRYYTTGVFSFSSIQVEIGSVETEYEPDKGQKLTLSTPNGLPGIPVSSGGNYTDASGQQWITDEIDFARGVYVQRIAKYIYTGQENWTKEANNYITNGVRFNCAVSSLPGACIDSVLSTHCVYSGTNKFVESIGMNMWVNSNALSLQARIVLPLESTVETLKAFLQEEASKGTPVEMLYALKTPIEIPLDEETLAAYASLHTNKPNTTVYNDGGAGMAMSYVADTKTYIDNKFTELQNAILAAGANV